MKKIYTMLLVLGLLVTLAGSLAAEDDEKDDMIPDNLVRPSTEEGEVFILGNMDDDDAIYPHDDQKGLEEPLILPGPGEYEEGLIIAPCSELSSFETMLQMVQAHLVALIRGIFSLPVA